jgi:hypothetical protein
VRLRGHYFEKKIFRDEGEAAWALRLLVARDAKCQSPSSLALPLGSMRRWFQLVDMFDFAGATVALEAERVLPRPARVWRLCRTLRCRAMRRLHLGWNRSFGRA